MSELSIGLGLGLGPNEKEDPVALETPPPRSTPAAQPFAAWRSCQSRWPRLCRCRPDLSHPLHPLVDPVPTYMTTRCRESPESPSPWPASASQWSPRAVTPSVDQSLSFEAEWS